MFLCWYISGLSLFSWLLVRSSLAPSSVGLCLLMVLARSSHHFFNLQQGSNSKVWRSLDSETNPPGPVIPARPPLFKTRSSSLPAPGTKKMDSGKSQARVGRGSVSNENNILLDPEVLTDYPTQVLVLTVLVCTL